MQLSYLLSGGLVSPFRPGKESPYGTCDLRKGRSSTCLLSPIKRTVKSPPCLSDLPVLRESQDVWEVLVLPVGILASLSRGECYSSVLLKRLISFLLPAVGSCGQMMPTWLAMFMEGPS